METLTQTEISNINSEATKTFKSEDLPTIRNNFITLYNILKSKETKKQWTIEDVTEILSSYSSMCNHATRVTCSVVRKSYFKEIQSRKFGNYEFCKACLVNNLCCGNPEKRTDSDWHFNINSIRLHLLSIQTENDIDMSLVKKLWEKIKASTILQNLDDMVGEVSIR